MNDLSTIGIIISCLGFAVGGAIWIALLYTVGTWLENQGEAR